jgi:thiol-disulfide isomerase/thioredoxin
MKSSNTKSILIALVLGLIGLLAIINFRLGSQTTIKDIAKDAQNSPSPTSQTELKAGASFPDFSVTDVDGKLVAKDSLKGKPAIIWFTTSWCVPCQIGAKEKVAPLDNTLGGNAFNVLVIFVDLREKDSDLINWRKQFANEDWMVAFDNATTVLAQKVNLKFLDSKFMLDKDGIIRNIDFKQADENYLNTIRQIVREK